MFIQSQGVKTPPRYKNIANFSMPRRKRKLPDHLFKPGQSGNPAGRMVGTKNEINQEIRQAFSLLLYNQLPNLEAWLAEGAKKDPLKTAEILLRVSERFLPSLQRTEITGKDGEAFSTIQIHLPNIGSSPAEVPSTAQVLSPVIPQLLDASQTGEGAPEIPDDSEQSLPGEESSAPSGISYTFLPSLEKPAPPPGWQRDL